MDKPEVGILPQNYIHIQHWSKAQGRICIANHKLFGKISTKDKGRIISSQQKDTAEALDNTRYPINTEENNSIFKGEIFSIKEM